MNRVETAPTSKLSTPPFVGPTDKAAHFQRHPIPGQTEMFAHSADEGTLFPPSWPVLADHDKSE